MFCGRNIQAAREVLDWPMKRAVSFYYTMWKYSPQYQVWKACKQGDFKSKDIKGRSFRGTRMRSITRQNYKA